VKDETKVVQSELWDELKVVEKAASLVFAKVV
jgi:hypothetical protein